MVAAIESTKDDDEERAELFKRMEHACEVFYRIAQGIGVHQFLEFTGLMREYVQICRDGCRAAPGAWPGHPLAMRVHNAIYLAEKLDCIYGESMKDPELRRAFVEAFLGHR